MLDMICDIYQLSMQYSVSSKVVSDRRMFRYCINLLVRVHVIEWCGLGVDGMSTIHHTFNGIVTEKVKERTPGQIPPKPVLPAKIEAAATGVPAANDTKDVSNCVG